MNNREIKYRVALIAVSLFAIFLMWHGCHSRTTMGDAYDKIEDSLHKEIANSSRVYAIARAKENEANEMKLHHAEVLENKNILQQEVWDLSGDNHRLNVALNKAIAAKDTHTVFKYIDTLSLTNSRLNIKVKSLIKQQKESDSLYEQRLELANASAKLWENSYRNCVSKIESTLKELPKLQPVTRLKLDVTAITGMVNGFGGGFTLDDPKGRSYTLDALMTNYGGAVMGKVSIPFLSFKRKK